MILVYIQIFFLLPPLFFFHCLLPLSSSPVFSHCHLPLPHHGFLRGRGLVLAGSAISLRSRGIRARGSPFPTPGEARGSFEGAVPGGGVGTASSSPPPTSSPTPSLRLTCFSLSFWWEAPQCRGHARLPSRGKDHTNSTFSLIFYGWVKTCVSLEAVTWLRLNDKW